MRASVITLAVILAVAAVAAPAAAWTIDEGACVPWTADTSLKECGNCVVHIDDDSQLHVKKCTPISGDNTIDLVAGHVKSISSDAFKGFSEPTMLLIGDGIVNFGEGFLEHLKLSRLEVHMTGSQPGLMRLPSSLFHTANSATDKRANVGILLDGVGATMLPAGLFDSIDRASSFVVLPASALPDANNECPAGSVVKTETWSTGDVSFCETDCSETLPQMFAWFDAGLDELRLYKVLAAGETCNSPSVQVSVDTNADGTDEDYCDMGNLDDTNMSASSCAMPPPASAA